MENQRKFKQLPSPTEDWGEDEEKPESVQARSVSRLPEREERAVNTLLFGEPDDDRRPVVRWFW